MDLKKEEKNQEREWTGRTFGSSGMHRALISVLRHVDPRCLYVFSWLFIVPVLVCFHPSSRSTYRMLRRRLGYSRHKSLRLTWRTFYRFSQTVLDRFAVYAGHKFDVTVDGMEHYNRLAAQPDGFIQLSSHIGNYELAGYTLRATQKPFNVLLYGGERPEVMLNRVKALLPNGINVIATAPDMSHIFEVNNALSRGETVSMAADRLLGSAKSIDATLLDAPVKLPAGPFAVIRARKCPVLIVNTVRLPHRRYHIYVTPLDYNKELPAKQLTDELVRQYTAETERVLRAHPEQWFNLYDFWK